MFVVSVYYRKNSSTHFQNKYKFIFFSHESSKKNRHSKEIVTLLFANNSINKNEIIHFINKSPSLQLTKEGKRERNKRNKKVYLILL